MLVSPWKPVPNAAELRPEPKASRVRVWQAADRILRSGRRPTVEGVRELLGGGSPNSVTAYINDWYQDLGTRLGSAEAPLAGLPSEAVSLLAELWRVAAKGTAGGARHSSEDDASSRLWEVERGTLEAQASALEILNKELQRHRASAEKSLAETRALLARREAALEEERSRAAGLDQALAQTRIDLEVVLERQRLAPARPPTSAARTPTRRKRRGSTPKAAHARRKLGKKTHASVARRKKATRARKRSPAGRHHRPIGRSK